MIKNDFYPTAATSYGIETTAPFMSIPDLIDKMGDQYLMGYVPSDGMGVEAVDITNTGDIITMSRKPGNFGWGYCQWGYNSSAGPGTIYYNDNGTLVRSWGINYDCAFINAAEMCRLNTRPGMSIYLSVASVHNNLIDGNKMTQFANFVSGQVGGVFDGWLDFTIDQYHDIIKNDTPFFDQDISIPNEGVTVHLTIRPSDFGNDDGLKFVLIPTGYDFVLHCRIPGFRLNESKYYYDSANIYTNNIMPFFQIPHNDGKMILMPGSLDLSYINITYSNGSITAGRGIGGDSNNKYIQNGDNATIFGAFDFGELSVNDIDFTRVFSSSGGHWAFVRNYVFVTTSTGSGTASFRINAMYTPRDVYNYIRFFHKRTDTPSDSYSTADTVTVFDVTDAPTFDTVSGTLSDIVTRLRPWQLPNVDISANDFTPEDIPTPEPEDADSVGDDIRDTDFNVSVIGAGNNFVTLYAMSSDSVSDMGKQLWASLSDPTYWQTVGTVFSNDFSINPADMLKYFLSLRYFPFNLSDLPHLTSPGVFIGRASAPLSPSTGIPFPLRLRKSICQLDGGSLTIRRKYNDFRDFEPCTTVQIHVPFCGTVDVPASEVVGKTLYLTYKIDLQTGAMLGVIAVQSNTYYVIATVAGSCGASIPITANNNIEFLQRIATVAGSGISGGISGGVKGASVGGEVGAVAGAIAGSVGGSVGALAGLPPVTVHRQGNASGFANLGGVPCAYVTIQRQRYSIPNNYGHTSGYACDVSETVGNLSGFAVCENVDTSGLSCNSTERAEIKRLLESGIYM